MVDAVCDDFDGDGEEELLLLCDGEPNRLFGWREGGWRPLDAGAATLSLGRHAGAVVVDLDRDGRPELVLLPGERDGGRPIALRAAQCRAQCFLTVAVRGLSGAPARGAEVRLRLGGHIRRRILDCGNGRIQGEPVARFGIGDGTAGGEIEVRWPDGAQLCVPAPAAGGTLVLRHPAAAVSPPPARSPA